QVRESGLDALPILAKFNVDRATGITPVSGGADTAIWRVATHDATYALRVFRPEQSGAVRRDVPDMRAAQENGLPVPTVHKETTWHERPALLLSWMSGHPL